MGENKQAEEVMNSKQRGPDFEERHSLMPEHQSPYGTGRQAGLQKLQQSPGQTKEQANKYTPKI